MIFSGKTDRGCVRDKNEDTIYMDNNLFIVADGMGGHLSGEVASQEAVHILNDYINNNFDSHSSIEDMLLHAINKTNEIIYKKAQSKPEYNGMGTTVTLIKKYKNELTYAHVGDSRIYLYKNNKLEQITKDHSFVEELVTAGEITEEEAKVHPQKNVITKAVGTSADVIPDIGKIELLENAIYLICSDGLSNMLSNNEIEKVLCLEKNNLEKIVDKLIELAKNAGGKDNISVICLKNN